MLGEKLNWFTILTIVVVLAASLWLMLWADKKP
jgi:hypothetical protein